MNSDLYYYNVEVPVVTSLSLRALLSNFSHTENKDC